MKGMLYSVVMAILLSILVYYFPYGTYSTYMTRFIIIFFYLCSFVSGIFLKYRMKNKRKMLEDLGSGLVYGSLLSFISLFFYVFYAYITYRG